MNRATNSIQVRCHAGIKLCRVCKTWGTLSTFSFPGRLQLDLSPGVVLQGDPTSSSQYCFSSLCPIYFLFKMPILIRLGLSKCEFEPCWPTLGQKSTFIRKSLLQNLIFHRILLSVISFFTKFIFLKSQFSQSSPS